MLYERLVLDLQRASAALRTGEPSQAHEPLLHAQDIVLELHSSLQADTWEGGPALASLYDYLHSELVRANVDEGPADRRVLPRHGRQHAARHLARGGRSADDRRRRGMTAARRPAAPPRLGDRARPAQAAT